MAKRPLTTKLGRKPILNEENHLLCAVNPAQVVILEPGLIYTYTILLCKLAGILS
jgi:hypothetical protein